MPANVDILIDKVLEGGRLEREEIRQLLELDPYSRESYNLQWAAHKLAHEASGGRGLLYSQIGIDANPCPGNCRYCSFAAINNDWTDKAEVPLHVILEYARVLSDNGVHLISLMTTANYDFDKYIDVLAAVRAEINPNIAIMVNIGDFCAPEAARLKEAGGTIVYHAIRVGEGEISDLDPQDRWNTLDCAKDAGLLISSGIGPAYKGMDLDAMAERIDQLCKRDLICSGVSELVRVKGTKMYDFETISRPTHIMYDSVWQLACGRGRAPFGHENIRWIDAGANPRGTEMLVGEERIKSDIACARKSMTDHEWTVPDSTVPFWELY